MIKKLEDICTVCKKNMSGQGERWAGRERREVSLLDLSYTLYRIGKHPTGKSAHANG